MRRVLNDDALENNFHKDGFVTIEFLNDGEIAELKQLIKSLNEGHIEDSTEKNSTYKLSFFNNDLAFKKTVFKSLTEYFQPKADRFLKGYKPLIINIFDKEPGKGEVPVHQNWTFVDERNFTSVSVWIPLVDVSRDNGTLEVVKGSHKNLCMYRSPSIPWVFDHLNDTLKKKYLVPFRLKAGQAAIIDDGILHWSSENKTGKVRTAVQLIMVPDDATPIHYVQKNDGEVDVYQVDALFFMQYNMKDIPAGYNIIGKEKVKVSKISERELVERVSINNPEIVKVYA